MVPPRHKHRRRKIPIITTHQDTPYEETEEASHSENLNHHNGYDKDDDADADDDEDQDEQHTIYTDTESGEPRNRFFDSESDPVSESVQEEEVSSFDETAASLNSTCNKPKNTSGAGYINIVPLPIFQGNPDESPVSHLSRFNKVCRANNALSEDMILRIFPVTLDNEAAIWYDLNIEPNPSLTWEEIKSSFLNFYQRTELLDQCRSELRTIKQRDNDSIHGYYLRLQWILKRWSKPDHGIPDGLLKAVFIDGLREDFQDWIVPQRPPSLEEALRLALTWEQVQSIRAARGKKVKCGFCEGGHEEKVCEIREKMRRVWLESGKEKEVKEKEEKKVGLEAVEALRGKELVRSMSMMTGVGCGSERQIGEEEENKEEGWKKRSQCQCWKHQCWKKNMERNNTVPRGSSLAAE